MLKAKKANRFLDPNDHWEATTNKKFQQPEKATETIL